MQSSIGSLENDKLLKALRGKNTGRPPFWFMRQAGRYQPSYQALRQKYSIEEMFHTPELIAQVTLLPVDELGVDAAILFSDILIPLELLGYSVAFPKGGPVVSPASPFPPGRKSVSHVGFVERAISMLRQTLNIPLIGFCGGPVTTASYIFEGRIKELKTTYLNTPHVVEALLEQITQVSIEYIQMQVEAGAQVIQLFDSWAGTLSPPHVEALSIPYLTRLVESVRVPVIIFSRGIDSHAFEQTGADCLSFDWTCSLSQMREKYPRLALQGNFDPEILLSSPIAIQAELISFLKSMKNDPGFIFNLGHGLTPDIPYENVQFLSECLRVAEPLFADEACL